MTRWTALFGAVLMTTLWTSGTLAQDIEDLDEGVVVETPFEPGVEPNKWEFTLQVGYIDFGQKLVGAQGILVDLEDPQQAIFGDMELVGSSSFHPQFKVNRTFGKHFALENALGFSIGDFEQNVSGDLEKWVDQQGSNTLTEIEKEQGSFFVWMHEHSLTWYPRGDGRVQPFLTAGAGTTHFALDSKYIEGTSGNFTFSVGGGLRVIGDDLYSLRIEVRQYFSEVEFTPASVYEQRPNLDADALIDYPVARLVDTSTLTDQEIQRIITELDLEFDVNSAPQRLPVPYGEFAAESFSNLWFSLGFVAAF